MFIVVVVATSHLLQDAGKSTFFEDEVLSVWSHNGEELERNEGHILSYQMGRRRRRLQPS